MIEKLKEHDIVDPKTDKVIGKIGCDLREIMDKLNELVDAVNGILDYAPLEMAMKAEPKTELERTRKALELAVTGLKNCKTRDHIGAVCRTPEYVDKILEQITALEQKE